MLDTYTGPPEFFSFFCRRRRYGTGHSQSAFATCSWIPISSKLESKNARLRQNLVLPGTSVKFKITRGATLIHGSTRALSGIPAYSRQLTYASRHRILSLLCNLQPFTVPSAAHLADCISTRLSPSRILCARMTALISASSV